MTLSQPAMTGLRYAVLRAPPEDLWQVLTPHFSLPACLCVCWH